MTSTDAVGTPSGHTSEGGVLVGNADASQGMVLFEDPQCPYCRQFEELNGPLITAGLDAGTLAVEYRMRCFLGPESVRADNALALGAEGGRFDELRQALFAAQPAEGTGGFTTEDLLRLGARVGLTGSDFVVGRAKYPLCEVGAGAGGCLPGTGSAGNTSRVAQRQPDRFERALRQGGVREATPRGDAARQPVVARAPNTPFGQSQGLRNVRTWPISSFRILPKRARASSSSCSIWAAARWTESWSR